MSGSGRVDEGIDGLSIFGKKKQKGEDQPGGVAEEAQGEQTDGELPDFSDQKARRFFEHAETVHEATNYEYAMTSWLNGLRQHPASMVGLEGFWKSATAFVEKTKGRLSKETRRSFAGRGDVERFLAALLEWGVNQLDPSATTRALEAAARLEVKSKLDMAESAYWIAERAIPLIGRDKKPSKELYVKVMEACTKTGAFDLAVRAGDAASKLDPSNSELANRVRNLAAQATMSTGGYENREEGAFRANIRDADRQRRLELGEQMVKTDEVKDQLIADAEEEFRKRPDDVPTINALVKALLERGRPEDESRAFKVLTKAYEKFNQFHFRQKAGEIRIRQARRKLAEYRRAAEESPEDEAAQKRAAQATRKFAEMELEEYRLRVQNYPTDVALKYELGRREFDLGNYDEAIALFQESQHDPRSRSQSLRMLGESFLQKGWIDEAIDTFRGAIEKHGVDGDEMGRELRYGLMIALQRKAQDEESLEAAVEAEKLASSIAIQQINFKDIRERRDALKKLVSTLREPEAG